MARYKKENIESIVNSNDFYHFLPFFLSTSTFLVFNQYDLTSGSLTGQIVDVRKKDTKIDMLCESNGFRYPKVSPNSKYIVWSCPEIGIIVSDMNSISTVVGFSEKMKPVNPVWNGEDIIFANSAESNEMLQAPVYSVSVDGKNLQKTVNTQYMGF